MPKGTKLFIAKYKHINLILSKRQMRILATVGSFKYLTTSLCKQLLLDAVGEQVVMRGARTGEVIQRELYELYHHGYLDRPVKQVYLRHQSSGSHEMIYCLTPKGRRVLEAERPGSTQGFIQPARKHQIAEYLHTLDTARVRTALMLGANCIPNLDFLFWQHGESIKLSVQLEPKYRKLSSIKPDGFFGLKFLYEGLPHKGYFFLEVDRSTMTRQRFARKLRIYEKFYEEGLHQAEHGINAFRVLTTTPSYERRDNLRELASESPLASAFYFACMKDFTPQDPSSIYNQIWVTGKHVSERSVLPS